MATLHTNSAAEALTRLINMGIEPVNMASTVTLIIAQRLVRLLCVHCQHHGCTSCTNGYHGRTGVFEMIAFNNQLKELILLNSPASVIAAAAEKNGMAPLWQMGLHKVNQGLTTLMEIHRVLPAEN